MEPDAPAAWLAATRSAPPNAIRALPAHLATVSHKRNNVRVAPGHAVRPRRRSGLTPLRTGSGMVSRKRNNSGWALDAGGPERRRA